MTEKIKDRYLEILKNELEVLSGVTEEQKRQISDYLERSEIEVIPSGGNWGANIGRILLDSYGDSVSNRA